MVYYYSYYNNPSHKLKSEKNKLKTNIRPMIYSARAPVFTYYYSLVFDSRSFGQILFHLVKGASTIQYGYRVCGT